MTQEEQVMGLLVRLVDALETQAATGKAMLLYVQERNADGDRSAAAEVEANRAADEARYARYEAILGAGPLSENCPK